MRKTNLVEMWKSGFQQLACPRTYFIRLFQESEISKPDDVLFARHNSTPYWGMERLLRDSLQWHGRPLIKEFFTESNPAPEFVPLGDMTGCIYSKTHPDFTAVKSDAPVSDADANKLAEQVFEGNFDCVARKGVPAKVVRQNWDGHQWFVNAGGSHRAAALSRYEGQQGRNSFIDCAVRSVDVSSELREFGYRNTVWLFKAEQYEPLSNALEQINRHHHREGYDFLKDTYLTWQGSDHYSLIVPNASKLHAGLFDVMQDRAFNLSDWIVAPEKFTFDHNKFLVPGLAARPPTLAAGAC